MRTDSNNCNDEISETHSEPDIHNNNNSNNNSSSMYILRNDSPIVPVILRTICYIDCFELFDGLEVRGFVGHLLLYYAAGGAFVSRF